MKIETCTEPAAKRKKVTEKQEKDSKNAVQQNVKTRNEMSIEMKTAKNEMNTSTNQIEENIEDNEIPNTSSQEESTCERIESYDDNLKLIHQIEKDISQNVLDEKEQNLNEEIPIKYEDIEQKIISPMTKVPHVSTQCFSCTCCERSFPLQQLLDIHMRQHTRERRFGCNECGKKFFSKHDLAKHIQTHTGDKPYRCVICDKSFSRATLLHRHEKIHISVPKYLCTYCDKTYLNSEDLDNHMRTHKKHRPFHCNQCDKKFAFKQGLERHELTHTADNPHKCNYCNETFATPSKLQRHITCHAGSRPYPCKLCPRTFLLSHHLTRHLRNHYNHKNKDLEGGEHKCDVCSMSFKRKFSLVNHSAIHSMVNLKCVICNKEFDDAQTVKDHITTHLSGLPFLCFKCDYSFENENDLLEHEQKHLADYDSENDDERIYDYDDANIKLDLENTNLSPTRRSQRQKKVKKFVDFLKDDEFSDSDNNAEEPDEDNTSPKVSLGTIQPVIRNESVKVYKGIKDKSTKITDPTVSHVPASILSVNDVSQKVSDSISNEQKSLTKITTLENLGLSKSALDAVAHKSGFVEMKIGQKVIRVQKLMMTKADVQAMAEQGRIEMKGTKIVVKNTSDINNLTTIGKCSSVVLSEDTIPMQVSSNKNVRTYVKKLIKRVDFETEISETDQIPTEFIIPDNVDIDLKSSNDVTVSTSIDEANIMILN